MPLTVGQRTSFHSKHTYVHAFVSRTVSSRYVEHGIDIDAKFGGPAAVENLRRWVRSQRTQELERVEGERQRVPGSPPGRPLSEVRRRDRWFRSMHATMLISFLFVFGLWFIFVLPPAQVWPIYICTCAHNETAFGGRRAQAVPHGNLRSHEAGTPDVRVLPPTPLDSSEGVAQLRKRTVLYLDMAYSSEPAGFRCLRPVGQRTSQWFLV